jgi:hypothetical protein
MADKKIKTLNSTIKSNFYKRFLKPIFKEELLHQSNHHVEFLELSYEYSVSLFFIDYSRFYDFLLFFFIMIFHKRFLKG